MKKIITASLVAMMAVTAAHADIASTTYVDSRTGDPATDLSTTAKDLTGAVNELAQKLTDGNLTIAEGAVDTEQLANDAVTSVKIANGTIMNEDVADNAAIEQKKIAGLEDALAAKEDVSNKANGVTDGMKKEQMYPTVAFTESLIAGANQNMSDLIGDVEDNKTVVQMITEGDSALAQRVTAIEGSGYANSGITSTKVDAYDAHVANEVIHVTADDKTNWNAKVATAQGSDNENKAMITDGDGNVKPGQIVSGMITDGTVAEVDIATSAVTTEKIADGNVTIDKLDGDVQESLNNAVQRAQVGMESGFKIDAKCKAQGVVCSLVVRGDGTNAVASWEVVAD